MPNDGWSNVELRELITVSHGFAFDSRHFNTAGVGYKLLTPANFKEDGGFRDLGLRQKHYSGKPPEAFLLKPGTLVVVTTEQAPGLIGSAAFIPQGQNFLHNQRLGVVCPKGAKPFNLGFAYHVFNFEPIRRQLSVTAAGTKVRHTSPVRIGQVRLMLPPEPEQRAIAQILDRYDLINVETSRLVSMKRRLKRGLMQQLLTGRRRFPEFAGAWIERRIGDVLAEQFRPVSWDDRETYRLASVRRNSKGLFWRAALTGKQIAVKKLHTIHAGDFLMSHIQAAYGAMAIVSTDFNGGHVSDMYTILAPKQPAELDIRFFGYLAERSEMRHAAYVSSNGFFAERLRLNFDPHDFLRRKISIPPSIAEQAKIVAVLSAADREIDLLERQLAALRDQKKGLMQKLLTGAIRVHR